MSSHLTAVFNDHSGFGIEGAARIHRPQHCGCGVCDLFGAGHHTVYTTEQVPV